METFDHFRSNNIMSRGDTSPVVLTSRTSIYILSEAWGVQDFSVGNLKFDSGGCCEMMAFYGKPLSQ